MTDEQGDTLGIIVVKIWIQDHDYFKMLGTLNISTWIGQEANWTYILFGRVFSILCRCQPSRTPEITKSELINTAKLNWSYHNDSYYILQKTFPSYEKLKEKWTIEGNTCCFVETILVFSAGSSNRLILLCLLSCLTGCTPECQIFSSNLILLTVDRKIS